MKKWTPLALLLLCACLPSAQRDDDRDDTVIIIDDDLPDVGEDDAGTDEDAGSEDAGAPPEEDAGSEPLDVVEQLRALDHVASVNEVPGNVDFRIFELEFTQPLDHGAEDGRTFTQSAIMFHRDEDAPVVMVNSGYGLGAVDDYENFEVEASSLLGANQLFIGHRFFTGAIPSAANQDWSTVTIEQAANDNHLIVSTLKQVYDEPWIGTGWSKGGMTVMLHAQFFPEDLDLALPMVAPLSFEPADRRYLTHLAQVGTPECRADLDASIRGSFERIDDMIDATGTPQNQRPEARAYLQNALATFPWAYWQYLGLAGCDYIPDAATATGEQLVYFYVYFQPTASSPHAPARPLDPEEEGIAAYYYQAMTQLGYQQSNDPEFIDSLVADGFISEDDAAAYMIPLREQYGRFGPWGIIPAFDPQPSIALDTWLREDASDMLAIYGAHDPWTGGKVTLDEANGSRVFIAPNSTHGTMLRDLTDADYEYVEQRIMQLSNSALLLSTTPGPRPEADREPLLRLLRQRAL